MKYHWMTFILPEAAHAFPQKAQGIRSFVTMNGVQDETVYMSNDKPLGPVQIRHVKAEAEANFGILSATKFNLSVSAVPLCGDCGIVLQESEIEDGFCAACLAGAVGEERNIFQSGSPLCLNTEKEGAVSMSGLDWDSVSYRNGEQHFGSDAWTGIGLPSYNDENRRIRVEVRKWIPVLYVDGEEVSLDPYVTSGDDNFWEGEIWEGEIDGYRFRIKRVSNLVDTEVIDPDGTIWTSRSGFTGWMEKCSLVPWTEDWHNA